MRRKTALSKKMMWTTGVVGIFLILIFGKIVYEKVGSKMVEDPSLKIEAILNQVNVSGELFLRDQGKGAVLVSAEEMSSFFKENTKSWIVQNEKEPLQLPTGLTLYLNLAEDYKINFYESEPELAMVQHQNHYQYYKISKETYQKLTFEYSIRSYLVLEPLMNAIADGKLTNQESVNDTPVNVTYKSAQIGSMTYYFYKRSGKYYVESPYFFIKEISKAVYVDGIAAIPE